VVAAGLVEHVDAEDGAERVLVGNPEEAEGADQHVHVDRRRRTAEGAVRVASVQDPGRDRDGGGIQVGEFRGLRDELTMVDVLDADQADEVRMRLVVVKGQLGERADRGDRLKVVDVQLPFRVPGGRVSTFKDRDVKLLLAGEVVVDHPLRRPGARRYLIDPRP
jgi:hypothetical protein